jgi:HD superfamily phosphohydrolase
MEIRDPVHGTIRLTKAESSIIESQEFQRLRAIKQLGFAEFSFPGATHNRFLHSIGVCHLAGAAFDNIFNQRPLRNPQKLIQFRNVVRAAALLHDIGHGPLSHTTEDVMPLLSEMTIAAYKFRKSESGQLSMTSSDEPKRASHEDYTIKYITDSPLTPILASQFDNFTPYHIALLIDRSLEEQDDFFKDGELDYRPILSQLVSSELDADRMDYLERDSYFCGTNYGKVDSHWLVSHMTSHVENQKVYLAINRRALYTFDDFLLSRHHMHLMVYFHHKSIIYEELLNRYLTSSDCQFRLPADINEYTKYNDHKLFENIAMSSNPWAQRIYQKKLYKVLLELHSTETSPRPQKIKKELEANNIDVIWASSHARLSKYHTHLTEEKTLPMFVVDPYNRWDKPNRIDETTEIFSRYEGTRIIDRLYVKPEDLDLATKIISQKKF